MVQVCWDWVVKGRCVDGMHCTKYHSYIRPETNEIIMRLYPKRNGKRQKEAGEAQRIAKDEPVVSTDLSRYARLSLGHARVRIG